MLLRAASYHEAGHCVAAAKLGYRVDWARADDRRGRMAYETPSNARDMAIVLLAGSAAQLKACPGTPLSVPDARAIAALDQEAVAHWRAEAEKLVVENWAEITDVAQRLMRAGRLEADEIAWACTGIRAAWCS
jgi:hypothetical protein